MLILATLAGMATAGSYFIGEGLPRDEQQALIELREGVLDSATWQMLLPFYEQPLVVPSGEVGYLRDIFPNLPEQLPVTEEVLRGYEPWTEDHINLFFNDFPYLEPFRPILSFQRQAAASPIRIATSSRLSGFEQPFRQAIHFTATPGNDIRADGTVAFEQNSARWQRRMVRINLPAVGMVQVGNFSFALNSGLFYGYFPGGPSEQDSARDNWLYGTSRTWNGLTTQSRLGSHASLQSCVHIRETESIGVLKAEFHPSQFVNGYAAVSAADYHAPEQTRDTAVAVHGGLAVTAYDMQLAVESGVEIAHVKGVPVYCTLTKGKGVRLQECSFFRLPAHYSAPLSSLLHSCTSRLELDSNASEAITGLNLVFRGTLVADCKKVYSATFINSGDRADIRGSIQMSGDIPFNYNVLYSAGMNNLSEIFRQRIKIANRTSLGRSFDISSTLTHDLMTGEGWRGMAEILAEIKLFTAMVVSAGVTFRTDDEANHALVINAAQQVAFFEKTYCQLTCSIPVISYYDENYYFYAKLMFVF